MVAITCVVNSTNPHADNIDGIPLIGLYNPQFNEFWDDKTPEALRPNYPRIPE